MKLKIADFIIEITNKYDFLQLQCAQYLCENGAQADITVNVTDDDIRLERLSSQTEHLGYLESVCAYRNLCLRLPTRDALLLHASVVDVLGEGVAFMAASGVGKTTHTLYWAKQLGANLKIVNGDKPIVRFFDSVPYAYGTAWAGKEGLQTNMRTPIKHLCFIERADENSCTRMNSHDCVGRILKQVLLPKESAALNATFDLVDKLLGGCSLWLIRCKPEPQAAKTAISAIFGEINYHNILNQNHKED